MSAGKLPEEWATSSIGDLCKKVTDGSHNPPKASETGLPMLSAKNISNGSVLFGETHRIISEAEFWEENKRTNIQSGDVLLTIVGTLGRTALVQSYSSPFTLQRSVAVMSAPELEPTYFRYALENREFQTQIHENAKGTAQKGIYLNALKKLTINIAPKSEQKITARPDDRSRRFSGSGVVFLRRRGDELQRCVRSSRSTRDSATDRAAVRQA